MIEKEYEVSKIYKTVALVFVLLLPEVAVDLHVGVAQVIQDQLEALEEVLLDLVQLLEHLVGVSLHLREAIKHQLLWLFLPHCRLLHHLRRGLNDHVLFLLLLGLDPQSLGFEFELLDDS
jgi:hypothetical protein